MGRALAIAHRDNDGALEARILFNAIDVAVLNLHFQEALEVGMRAIELTQSLDDPDTEVNCHFFVAVILAAWGERDRASRHAEACLSVAEKLRDRHWLGFALLANQLLVQFVGDWKAARDFSDRGLSANSIHFCCQSAKVGQIGTREDYCYEELRVSSLRVLL